MANLKVSEQAYPTTRYTEAAAPATPAAGEVVIYAKADGNLYQKDDAGTETLLANAAGGTMATDALWDAKGDLAAGTGANTASKLTVGANDTILMADSGQSTGLKWVASQTPSTQAFGDSAAEGTADTYARGDHKHAMPASPGGGALVWLQRQTASASASLNFTSFISSTYDIYEFHYSALLNATSATNFQMQMGSGAGPTYDTGANYTYEHFVHRAGASAVTGGTGATSILLNFSGATVSTAVGGIPMSGHFTLYTPMHTTYYKHLHGELSYYDGSFRVTNIFSGRWESATAMTAIKFFMSSGNLTSGNIDVYGRTHA